MMTGMTLHLATPVPELIRTITRSRGLRQSDVAEAIGVTRQALVRRLQGTTRFSDTELSTIAELLDVPVGALFGEVEVIISTPVSPADVDAGVPDPNYGAPALPTGEALVAEVTR